MTVYLRLFALFAVVLLQACATNTVSQRYPTQGSQPVPPTPRVERNLPPTSPFPPSQPSVPAPPSEPARASDSPAVIALLDRAHTQYQGHDLNSAAASLERALRIEPRNPQLWQRLANIRLEQGQWGQASQMAARSNSYAGRDSGLRARNWEIIAAARRAEGDVQGAATAELKARQLE